MKSIPPDTLATFNDSLETCNRQNPDFLERFYEIFINSSPKVREKFKNTNIHQQQRFLNLSLYLMVMAAIGKPEGDVHLKRIAERHSHLDKNIEPELYKLWLECLVETVKEFDPYYIDETETAWRTVLQTGIDYMISKY